MVVGIITNNNHMDTYTSTLYISSTSRNPYRKQKEMSNTIQDNKDKNFRDNNGKLFLIYCYACNKENYLMRVASGICEWCGWKESDDNI